MENNITTRLQGVNDHLFKRSRLERGFLDEEGDADVSSCVNHSPDVIISSQYKTHEETWKCVSSPSCNSRLTIPEKNSLQSSSLEKSMPPSSRLCPIMARQASAKWYNNRGKLSYRHSLTNQQCNHVLRLKSLLIYIFIGLSTSFLLSESADTSPGYQSLISPLSRSDLIPCEDVFRGTSSSSQLTSCMCSRPDSTFSPNAIEPLSHPSLHPLVANGTAIICDHVSFFGDFPSLPFRGKIHTFSQRYSWVQGLEPQLFTASAIPLVRVDFSHNRLRRLMERVWDGVEGSLRELDLSHNLLGDQLNPIFSTNEFLHLKNLVSLNLGHNGLRALDNNLFKGLRNLTNLDLEGNELSFIPVGSLNGLSSLKWLNLGSNAIREIRDNSFPSNLDRLISLNLSSNTIEKIRDGAFSSLESLQELYLSSNLIKDFGGQALTGLKNLEILDLSNNFLEYIPSEAIQGTKKLKRINLSSNNIISIDERSFFDLTNLESIDLSRNNIKSIASADSLHGLSNVKFLNLAYNKLKSVDEMDESIFASFKGLEVLDLTDNEILNFPTRLLHGCPKLKKIFLDYNLIGRITEDSLSTITEVDELSLSYNLVTELPDGVFDSLKNLRLLNLHGNKLDGVSQATFRGLADNLLGLDIGYNDLVEIPKLTMPKLMILNMAANQFTHVPPGEEPFKGYPSLRFFNLSGNHLSFLPPKVFDHNVHLEIVDLTSNVIDRVGQGIFSKLNLTTILLGKNSIKELTTAVFHDLKRIKSIDLSDNEISNVKNGAFDGLTNVRQVNLRGNKLTSFKGDFFSTRTRLEVLDLSGNQISYLYPNSFNIHRRLRKVNLEGNKLTFFPTEIISGSRLLEYINLRGNKLSSLESADFSSLPNLRYLDLSSNDITFLPNNAFGNSTNLNYLNCSNNRIATIGETAFRGISRLSLDLSYNELTNLPVELFNRRHVFSLVQLNLSKNNLTTFPSASLRKQYSSLEELDISYNRLSVLPSNSDVLVNLKKLDISFNPLNSDTLTSFFSEPKSVRILGMAGVGLTQIATTIEMPFIKSLNLSSNAISVMLPSAFEKTSLIRTLDLSRNQLSRLTSGSISADGGWTVWKKLPSLQSLFLSGNPIQNILKGDLDGINRLATLDISNLTLMTHFECESLAIANHLRVLLMSGYPSLEKLDIQECLSHVSLKSIRKIALEFKEPVVQGQLQRLLYYSKVGEVILTGKSITTLAASTFSGIKSEEVIIRIRDTRIKEIPDSLFSSFPLTTRVFFDVSGNEIPSLSTSLINSLDNKLLSIRISGLEANPFICDCRSEPAWKWANLRIKLNPNVKYYNSFEGLEKVTCSLPTSLTGHRLVDLEVEQLACQTVNILSTMPSSSSSSLSSTTLSPPVIIVGPKRTPTHATHPPGHPFHKVTRIEHADVHSSGSSNNFVYDNKIRRGYGLDNQSRSKNPAILQTTRGQSGTDQSSKSGRPPHLTRVDTMIIGIIAGIIAFICILVLIICVMKVKSSIGVTTRLPPPSAMTLAPSSLLTTKACTCATYPGLVCQACTLTGGPPVAPIHSIYGVTAGRGGGIGVMAPGPRPPPTMSIYGHVGGQINRTANGRPMTTTMVNALNGRRMSSSTQSGKVNGWYSDIPEENFK